MVLLEEINKLKLRFSIFFFTCKTYFQFLLGLYILFKNNRVPFMFINFCLFFWMKMSNNENVDDVGADVVGGI